MQIRIIKPGLLSTVQDMGRSKYLAQAVPVSGAMDILSARIANKAVGNADEAAVIEFTYAAAEFITETDVLIAYSGSGAVLKTDQRYLPTEKPVFIPQGTIVKLVNNPAGSRTYLAIAGGFDVPEVLGSRSTYLTAAFGGLNGRRLKKDDVLCTQNQHSAISAKMLTQLKGDHVKYTRWGLSSYLFLPANRKIIRVVPGNELSWFRAESIIGFLSVPFTLSYRTNRMGYHLEGPVINRLVNEELISTAVTPGTIQVTGNGSPMLLMADCQTTGGYPRIAQVAAVDLPLCAQLKPGDRIYFEEISREDAEMLYIGREHALQRLTTAIAGLYA
jgi:antagonist of KipI